MLREALASVLVDGMYWEDMTWIEPAQDSIMRIL
jgi:hypothetical protein